MGVRLLPKTEPVGISLFHNSGEALLRELMTHIKYEQSDWADVFVQRAIGDLFNLWENLLVEGLERKNGV